jgi:hypothetical protein
MDVVLSCQCGNFTTEILSEVVLGVGDWVESMRHVFSGGLTDVVKFAQFLVEQFAGSVMNLPIAQWS